MTTRTPGSPEEGFTLIEILIVLVILGILAGIAIPNFQGAVWKARAAEVVTDVHTVTLAFHEYLADGGRRVRIRPWGTLPNELRDYLPENFPFQDDFVEYRWTRVGAAQSPWGVETGMLRVRPRTRYRKLMMPKLELVAPSGTSVVTRNQVRFYITP